MSSFNWKYIILFIALVLLQVLFFNSICLWGSVVPMVYIMFVLSLPFQTPAWLVVSTGFLMGFFIDMFSGVMGVHAASLTLVAFLRPAFMQLIPHTSIEEHMRPILQDMHFPWFASYTLLMAFVHQFCIYFFDSLSFVHFWHLLWMALINAFFTTLIIILIQMVFYNSSKRY